jgi:hypothetical protein
MSVENCPNINVSRETCRNIKSGSTLFKKKRFYFPLEGARRWSWIAQKTKRDNPNGCLAYSPTLISADKSLLPVLNLLSHVLMLDRH